MRPYVRYLSRNFRLSPVSETQGLPISSFGSIPIASFGSRADDWCSYLSTINRCILLIACSTSFEERLDGVVYQRAGFLVCGTQVVTSYCSGASAFLGHTMYFPQKRARIQPASNGIHPDGMMLPINATDGHNDCYDLVRTQISHYHGTDPDDLSKLSLPSLALGQDPYNLQAQQHCTRGTLVPHQSSVEHVTNRSIPSNSFIGTETSTIVSSSRDPRRSGRFFPPSGVDGIEEQAFSVSQATLQIVPYDPALALTASKSHRNRRIDSTVKKDKTTAVEKRTDVLVSNVVRVSGADDRQLRIY